MCWCTVGINNSILEAGCLHRRTTYVPDIFPPGHHKQVVAVCEAEAADDAMTLQECAGAGAVVTSECIWPC